MHVNGHDPLLAAVEQAKQQQAQQQMLRQVLQQALNQPAKITQFTGPTLITAVKGPDGGRVLLVALVTGERFDIPLDDATSRRVAFSLAAAGDESDDEAKRAA